MARPALIRILLALLAGAIAGCADSSGYDITTPLTARADVDRSIDLSDATGPLPLDTPEDAARAAIGARLFYTSVIDTLGGGTGSGAKATTTEACADGGWRTEDESTTRRAVRYENCLEGYRFTDGFLSAGITRVGYPWSDGEAQIGENDTPLLGENRDPDHDIRSLQLGTLVGEVKINSSGDLEEVDAHVNLVGSQADLDGTPRMNYGMDNTRVHVKFEGDTLLVNEAGAFRLSGDCGVGNAQVNSPRGLRVHQDTGAVTDGELLLGNAVGQSATVIFNADQSVDATVADGTAHYTLEEFRAICDF